MKKLYFKPLTRSVTRFSLERCFCGSVNVTDVTTGSQNGLEGWSEDPEVGEWE